MNERDRTRLRDMLDAARKAIQFTQGRARADLDRDDLLSFGLVRAVEIVGEAASRVSPETRAQYPHIPWKAIIGTRNKVIHDYISVDHDILWDTVSVDLPELIAQLEGILNPLENTGNE